MDLSDLIAPDAIFPELKAKSKKQALQAVAQRAAKLTGLDERAILDTLLQRERLGSTGIGRGIAIPHGRVQGLQRIVSVFARLEDPIEFEALDDGDDTVVDPHGEPELQPVGDAVLPVADGAVRHPRRFQTR